GLTSFSRFTGTSDIIPLPVNLVSFTANRLNETSVRLNWRTAGEENNDRFEIERSSDGVNFFTVGEVAGNGTTNTPLSYMFEDRNATLSPVLYYRLKQVDYNGAFEYSPIARVANTIAAVDMKAWYNQTNEKIQLAIINTISEQVIINVMDMQGKLVANLSNNV